MRPEKKAIIEEIKGRLQQSPYTVLVNYKGLTVGGLTQLRRQLRPQHARLDVVKNAYLGHACSQAGLPSVDALLEGPIAIVTGAGDVTAVAKALVDFGKTNEALAIRGGLLDGACLSAADMKAMASVPSREVLLGMFVGTLAAPMSRLVGVLQQKVATVVYALKAIEEKKSKA
jgi:large subunit ribosomal protein L10